MPVARGRRGNCLAHQLISFRTKRSYRRLRIQDEAQCLVDGLHLLWIDHSLSR
jgi:hypothetical protein